MKTNLDSLFKADENLEKTGVWLNISEETGFLVRPFMDSNPRVRAAMAKDFKPHARLIDLGTLPEKKEREIMTKIFVNACVEDWKGVKDDAGEEIPFSKEKCVELLMDLPQLMKTLMSHAQDFKNYKQDATEALGNS